MTSCIPALLALAKTRELTDAESLRLERALYYKDRVVRGAAR